jgi:hypothetical protein
METSEKQSYYYELKYTNGENIMTRRFPAAITTDRLKEELRWFLLGCSWLPEQVDQILGIDSECTEEL